MTPSLEEMKWTPCDGTMWDYEKVFYQVKLVDGSVRWAWPNAGMLFDVGFDDPKSDKILLLTVVAYRKAEDEYYNLIDKVIK